MMAIDLAIMEGFYMEREYSVAEARNQLAALVHEAEAGKPVRITRWGRPVAVLLSEREYERLTGRLRGFWDAYEAFRASLDPGDLQASEDAFQDVRDRSPGREVEL
jgi:prevent-host-death family protein